MKKIVVQPNTQTILNAFANKKIVIPPYQRFYVWEKEQVQQLLTDIKAGCNEERSIYLGSIIIKTDQQGRFRLIDGQQRVLTIFILLRQLLNSGKITSGQQNIIESCFLKTEVEEGYSIDFNDEVRAKYFQDKIFKGDKVEHPEVKILDHILSAEEIIEKEIKSYRKEKAQKLTNYIFKNIEFILIKIDIDAIESEIFESINSNRVELSDTDLIKSYIFSRCSKAMHENLAKKLWREFDNQLESEKEIDSFIECYCLSKASEPILNQENAYYRFFKRLGDSFENVTSLLNDLEKVFAVYLNLVNHSFVGESQNILDLNSSLRCLSFLRYRIQQPLILSLFCKTGSVTEQHKNLVEQIELMLFLRRDVRGDLPQSIKDDVHSLLWEYNATGGMSKLLKKIRLKNAVLRKENRVGLGRFKIKRTSQRNINYLLYRIIRRYGYKLDASKIELKNYKKSLEHILPQKYKKNWLKVIKNDIRTDKVLIEELKVETFIREKEQFKYYFDNYIQSLGNFAFLTGVENSRTGNKSFKGKKEVYLEYEKLNPFLVEVIKERQWDSKKIRENGIRLADRYLRIFH